MATSTHRGRSMGPCLGGLLAGLAILATGTGCVTGTYRARDLPPEFAATPIQRLDKADLSRLTTYTVRSDQVGVGDVLEVLVFSSYGESDAEPQPMLVRVARNGTADVPLIGPVTVDGLTLDMAERAIAAAAVQRDIYRTPHVTVTMDEQRKNHILVLGAVENPGMYEIPRGTSTLLSAFVEAGGLTDKASHDVTIRRPALSQTAPDVFRGNPLQLAGGGDGVMLASYEEGLAEQARTVEVNLVSATEEGHGGYYLDDGDVVYVKEEPDRKVHVMGLVGEPGEIEMPPNEDLYLLNAISLAGGLRMQAANDVLIIRRISGREQPVKIRVSIREARDDGAANPRLQENDLVVVEETPITMTLETMKTFFRFSVGSSMALF